jgi:protease-4
MGNVAASGGYVVAMDADLIVAHPATITGSIGVVGGKLVLEEFFASMGINADQIQVEEGENFYASMPDYSPEDWDRFQLFLDRIYDDFVQGVAEGRGMTVAEVDAVARGRIWSGRDAFELGLVDRLGGFPVALDAIRELLEVETGSGIDLVVYPAERTLLQLLLERASASGGAGVLSSAPAIVGAALFGDMVRGVASDRIGSASGSVRAPSWEVPGR